MAVSLLMLDKLMEVYTFPDHMCDIDSIDIHDRTYNALKYRGYLDKKEYKYYVTSRGIKYLKRYHKKRLESYELSKGYNKE